MNINLAATYFSGQNPTGQINFCKKLAKTLIFNMHYNEDDNKTPDKKRKHREYGHCLITLPKSKKFSGTQIIAANSEYLQHKFTASLPHHKNDLFIIIRCGRCHYHCLLNGEHSGMPPKIGAFNFVEIWTSCSG